MTRIEITDMLTTARAQYVNNIKSLEDLTAIDQTDNNVADEEKINELLFKNGVVFDFINDLEEKLLTLDIEL